jgi:hypothetical protein
MKRKLAGNMLGKIGILKMDINALKDNELITGISVLATLKHVDQMEIAKCMLIEPLLSYSKVLQLLRKSNSSVKSVEDLIMKESITFSNFNERYRDKFILSINSIILFKKMGLLSVEENMIIFRGNNFNFNESSLGKKASTRILASKNLAKILSKGETSDLYLSLRIKI